jgi:hypothetical protein
MQSAILKQLLLEELHWQDVEAEVRAVNNTFASLIHKLKPSKNCTVFKAIYPYGAKIFHDGLFNLPLANGTTIPITSHLVPSNIKTKLAYNPLPVSLILKNNCEVYAETQNHFTPFRIYQPGEVFGTWELFEPEQSKLPVCNWDISAGARSVIMLPKIAINYSHNKLRAKYNFNLPPPSTFANQHELFTKLAQHSNFPEKWSSTVLFFSKEWVEQENDFMHLWSLFKYYLLRESWNQAFYLRNQLGISLLWQSLAAEMQKMTSKPRNYIIETVKKLIMIGIGTDPAFAPAHNSSSLPIKGLQSIYINDYKIEQLPTIMEPRYLYNIKDSLPVYYSLQCPTLLQYPSKYDTSRSAMQDLETIKQLIDLLKEKLKKDNLRESALIEHLQFDYFHTENDPYRVMHLSDDLPKTDSRFIFSSLPNKKLEFANNASFVRGCIKISILN